MPGWPTRISRDALGPELADIVPPPNPRNFVGADVFKLGWWTLSGLAQVSQKAWIGYAGATNTLQAHGEAWAPNGGAAPTPTKNSTGSYTFVYPTSVTDESGASIAPGLSYAKASPQSTSDLRAVATVTGGNTVEVRVFNAAGAAADATIFVEAF